MASSLAALGPLGLLFGVGLLVAASSSDDGASSSSSSSSSGSSTTTGTGGTTTTTGGQPQTKAGGIPGTIELTCDQAIALLPGDALFKATIADAILHGTVPAALNTLADQMDSFGDQVLNSAGGIFGKSDATEQAAAAYHVVAHCLRVRAATLLSPAVPNKATPFAA